LILKGTYDDNIFWSDGHEQSDLIFTISPSLRLEYPGDDYLIRLAGRTDLQYFSKYTGENHCNYNLEGVFDYSFSKYVIKIKDVFRKTSARFDTEQRTRIPRIENTGRIGLLRDFQDLEIEIAYQNFYRHFLRSDYTQYDHQQHSGIGTIFYRVAPQVKILGEYTYDRILYRLSTERNGYYNEVRAGLKGSLTDKLTVTAKVGYQAREYDQAGLENYDGPVGFVALEEYFSPYLNMLLVWERTIQESTYSINNFYILNRLRYRVSQQLFQKVRGYLDLSYQNHRYKVSNPGEPKRDDDIWTASPGVRYQIQPWLYLDLNYSFRKQDSNISGGDYQDNRTSLILSAYY